MMPRWFRRYPRSVHVTLAFGDGTRLGADANRTRRWETTDGGILRVYEVSAPTPAGHGLPVSMSVDKLPAFSALSLAVEL